MVGTAGWSISASERHKFTDTGSLLHRYAARLGIVEINSSFYRPHRLATYQRWAAEVPDGFRFAVKLPKAITHERRLVGCEDLLDEFFGSVEGLGPELGVVLAQLPPSLGFDDTEARAFFEALRDRTGALVACEPRHPGWFGTAPNALLAQLRVARVGADPEPVPGAGEPGGWQGLVYIRLHGSPRMYYSDYDQAALASIADRLLAYRSRGIPVWCIFDNTAAGHALGNALQVAASLTPP